MNRNDSWHEAMCERPKATGGRLILTDSIVDEACTLFVTRKTPHQKQRLCPLIDHARIVNFTWIGSDLFAQAREWMLQWKDQPLSLTDGTSFACLKSLGISKAEMTDDHFRTAGFEPLFLG